MKQTRLIIFTIGICAMLAIAYAKCAMPYVVGAIDRAMNMENYR